jgi:tetratricopeptide (TPR) repeat protein
MEGYEVLCLANNFLGRPDRAMEYADTAIRLGPRDPYIFSNYHSKGWAFFMKEQDDHAIEWLRRSAAAAPGAEPFTYLLQTRPGNLDAEDLARRCKAGDWSTAAIRCG